MSNKTKGLQYVFQPGELAIRLAQPRPGFTPSYEFLTADNFDVAYNELDGVVESSFDTETTSLYIDELLLVSFSFAYANRNYVCLVNHESEEHCFTDLDKLQAIVDRILSRQYAYLWNAPFDLRVAEKALGLNKFKYHPTDVSGLVFLADTNVKMPSLKDSEYDFLGIKAPSFEEAFGKKADIQHVDPLTLGWYSAFDSYSTLELGKLFRPELEARYRMPVTLDRKFIPALMYFEEEESQVSEERLVEIQEELHDTVLDRQTKIYEEVGVFNIGSAQQLSAKLLERGYDTGARTATGQMSTKIAALKAIGKGVPFIENVIEYKKLTKLDSGYIQPMLKRLSLGLPFRFHYILNNAPTMRLAAGAYSKERKKADQQKHYFADMNIQAISKPSMKKQRIDWDPTLSRVTFDPNGKYLVEAGSRKMNLRRAWVPPSPDYVYWAIDYAGQELRIAANLSGEKAWIDAFMGGEDVHKITAEKIWGASNYTKDLRKKAKIANFLTVYGGTKFALMNQLGMSETEAIDFQESFKAALPSLFTWAERMHTVAKRQGYIITPYGVPRRLMFYYRLGRKWAGYADRSATNTPIQGSAGMIIRIALVRLFQRIARPVAEGIIGDFYPDVRFRECIHDEIGGVCKDTRFPEFVNTMVPIMTETTPKNWIVPMDVEVSVGPDWGSIVPVDHHKSPLMPIEVEPDEPSDKDIVNQILSGEMFDSDSEGEGETEFVPEDQVAFFG